MNHERPADDERIAKLLATTAGDAAPPNAAAIAALRELAATAFATAEQSSSTPSSRFRSFAMRALVALAATAAIVAAAMYIARPAKEPTLGEALRNLAAVHSFSANVWQDGQQREVWGRSDGRWRIETTPTQYLITDGSQAWEVNEAENRAQPIASPVYSKKLGANDPLRALGLSADDFLDLRPTERVTAQANNLLIYSASRGDIEFVATVDARDHIPRRFEVKRGESHFFVHTRGSVYPGKFQVADTLTADGRIGKIVDFQGLVSLRPLTSTRWTPVCGQHLLRLGDRLKTGHRGANAVTIQLAPQTMLILGPGSLIELKRPDQIVLHAGIAEITPSPKANNFSGVVNVAGPNTTSLQITAAQIVTAKESGLATKDMPPAWLAGYKGQAVQESLGSLVATIDGREVPLTVGYHRVSVEIRDQIARTTIEESFVNHADEQLEGVFHFPLPADASISGFGMWIGDKLVEADIVEKQRAREIYETILREKRDPGLLEWSGGNVFKARVFPIFPKSEKRIKIVYTQVLPRKGDSYRYSYALQSELLRKNPLRQLDLDVTIFSTQPLAGVDSPTHATRNQMTEHAARVEFTAANYTPDRDFEVVVTPGGQSSELTFIPHQRGDDGYFLLMLQPPTDGGAWQREVLPSGKPLNLVVLADTSASLDRAARRTQAEVIAALLGSLSPDDTFQLAACDVDCVWATEKPQSPGEKQIAAARDFLAGRQSLGWTDLDKTFSAAIMRARPGAHIVYVGDGIVTAGEADGAAFARRLKQVADGKELTIHAIAVSSSYDAPVLRAMAEIGGGSMRQIGGDLLPPAAVRDLLAEITRPALKNIQLEFAGLRTARVYPRTLPNVPAGTQQIILGRYLPMNAEQTGEVIATGTLDGKRVTYRTKISKHIPTSDSRPPTPDSDASFIPRLWARLHVDELLAQGTSQDIQDEVVALSEEFHIMTPYTSLLVLESDADRERFKVKKRFLMKDGEKFFAEGRDESQYQLVQQQMQQAGLWRVGLRNQVLHYFATLGRDRAQVEATIAFDFAYDPVSLSLGSGKLSGDQWGYGGLGGAFGNEFGLQLGDRDDAFVKAMHDVERLEDHLIPLPSPARPALVAEPSPSTPAGTTPRILISDGADPYGMEEDGTFLALGAQRLQMDLAPSRKELLSGKPFGVHNPLGLEPEFIDSRQLRNSTRRIKASLLFAELDESKAQSIDLLGPLFPVDVPLVPEPVRKPTKKKSTWPKNAQALSRSLRATIDLSKLDGGLIVEEQTDDLDAYRQKLDSRTSATRLLARDAWLTRTAADGGDVTFDWSAEGERGAASTAYEFAVVRKSEPADQLKEFDAGDWWRGDVQWHWQDYLVEIEQPAEGQKLLLLRHVLRPHEEVRLLVDTAKNAASSIEWREYGRATHSSQASDLVEIGGVWLPQRVEDFDREGRRTRLVTRKYTVEKADAFAARLKQELDTVADFFKLTAPFADFNAAKTAASAGKGKLEDHLLLLIDFAAADRWPEAAAQLDVIANMAANKPFVVWMRLWLLQASRRNEELRQLANEQAAALAKTAQPTDIVLAERLVVAANQSLDAHERLALLDALRPIYAAQPEHLRALNRWTWHRVRAIPAADRPDELLNVYRTLAEGWRFDAEAQETYANHLASIGEYAEAYAWLKQAIDWKDANWPPDERDSLYEAYAELLKQQGRYADLAEWIAAWAKLGPTDSDHYERYLAALIYTDRQQQADELMRQWLTEGLAPPPLAEAVRTRRDAAIETALGDNNDLGGGHFSEQWTDLLTATVVEFVEREDRGNAVWKVTQDWQLRETEAFHAAASKLLARLKEHAADLPPASLEQLADWVASYAMDVERDQWQEIATVIRQRWQTAEHPTVRQSLADSLLVVLSQIGHNERIAFLREQLQRSAEPHEVAQHARKLFEALMQADWSNDIEAESLALIERLSAAEDAEERLAAQVSALYQWTDRMVESRYAQAEGSIEHPEKLTRTALRDKRFELRNTALLAVAERLADAAGKRKDAFRRWLQIERLTLLAQGELEMATLAPPLWELLGAARQAATNQKADPASTGQQLDAILRTRALTMLGHLATRRDGGEQVANRLTKWLDEVLEADPTGESSSLDARAALFALLVALDKPRELENRLNVWSRTSSEPARWNLALAYLQAELGKLAEAAELLQALEASDSLVAEDYRTLANWRQALNQRERYDAALAKTYEMLNEYELRDIIRAHLAPWQQSDGPTPAAIEPEVFVAIRAMLTKAADPEYHVYHVREFYEASRDFRLLAALAEGVIGQSQQKVYPLLRELRSVLDEIDREATAEELVLSITNLRDRKLSAADRRALDLLELLVERRAAELQDAPGPHVVKAIASLKRATKDEWSAGEPRQMAELLAGLGGFSQQPLAEAVLQVFPALQATVAGQPDQRLAIAHSWAQSLVANSRSAPARDVLTAAIAEHRAAHGGKLRSDAIEPLFLLARLYGDEGQFVQAERTLQDERQRAANPLIGEQIMTEVLATHRRALAGGGATSLGSGAELYRAAERALLQSASEAQDPAQRQERIGTLCDLYRAARERKLPTAAADVVRFGGEDLPPLLKRQVDNYQDIVWNVARAVYDLAGPREGLAFLVARIEEEPKWLVLRGDTGWERFASSLGAWREEAAEKQQNLSDLEPRLLAIILAELKRDLTSRDSNSRVMYSDSHSYFWSDKRVAFRKAAEEVLAAHPDSEPHLLFIAEYLFDGLDAHDRAVEILLAAHQDKLLGDEAQSQLANYLARRDRFGEAALILAPLVERDPDSLGYRTRLMHAYFRSDRPQDLQALLAATDKRFREEDRWSEQVAARLGESTLENELYDQAAAYFAEAIGSRKDALAQETASDETLTRYALQQARAWAGLKKTAQAVDAACEAIVIYGVAGSGPGGSDDRTYQPLEVLREVLQASPDLDSYVKQLDAEVAATQEDRPVVRKALGQVYQERQAYDRAIVQLKLALELSPNDPALHAALVECYDAQENEQAAADQVLTAAELSPRDLELWEDLAARLESLKQSAAAERARTSLVEISPEESEGHERLAQLLAQSRRWDESEVQWRHVARLRKLEPTGLLGLAAVQIERKDRAAGEVTLKELETTEWPARFHDQLREKLPQLKEAWGEL